MRLPVYTASGVRLGRVSGFEFEAESQTIVRYVVRRSFFGSTLLIHRNQVISFDANQLTVEDLVVSQKIPVYAQGNS